VGVELFEFSLPPVNALVRKILIDDDGERDRGLAGCVAVWFHRVDIGPGMIGFSRHSGCQTFITRAARKIGEVSGSPRDIQQLAGHASLGTTARISRVITTRNEKSLH
jgi:hypothetical protein